MILLNRLSVAGYCDWTFEVGRQSRVGALEVQQNNQLCKIFSKKMPFMRNWHKWQMILKNNSLFLGGLIYPLSIVERERMWVFDNTDTQGGRGWETPEEWVGTLIPLY